MDITQQRRASHRPHAQRGLTLVEFMVAIVLGMLMVAAIATLIANQSTNRAEIDRAGKMLENGRYAIQAIADDAQMAGYWGETIPTGTPALPNPCATAIGTAGSGDLQDGMLVHVQGYDGSVTLPAAVQVCVKNRKSGTDVLVVRHADPDTSGVETGGVVDFTKVGANVGQVYMQTGLDNTGTALGWVLAAANGTTDAATFAKFKKDKTTKTSPRKYLVHIYYIAKCSVEISGSCTNADGGTPIPTLKRVDLSVASSAAAMSSALTIAEGIENLQVDYGLDTDSDGVANGDYVDGTSLTAATWGDVVSLRIYLIARSTDKTPGFTDTKSYVMGTAGAASAPAGDEGYRRHVFVQSVRLVNPSARKAS